MNALARENYLADVRAQYEALPYPHRDPQDELKQLRVTQGGRMEYLNHYAFSGKMPLQDMRVLEAGGGTGDATVFMAEQLLPFGGTLTYVDMSQASLEVAKQRAEMRKLDNIEFIHGSLLDLPEMGLEPFDYIGCSGVLHHLEDPSAGLRALKSVLKPEGAINMMVYGQYGRADIYRMQALMKLVNAGVDGGDVPARISGAKMTLESLKGMPWLETMLKRFNDTQTMGDAGLYDLFLHTQDRAYTIPDLYEWVASCDMHLHYYQHPPGKPLKPAYLSPSPLRDWLMQQDELTQQAVMELVRGDIAKHQAFLTHAPREAIDFADSEMVPFLTLVNPNITESVAALVSSVPDDGIGELQVRQGHACKLRMTPLLKVLFRLIDGERTIGDITAQIASQNNVDAEQLSKKLATVLKPLCDNEIVFLRHQSVPAFPSLRTLQQSMQARRS